MYKIGVMEPVKKFEREVPILGDIFTGKTF